MESQKEKAAPTAAIPNPTSTNNTSAATQRNTIKRIIRKNGAMTTLDARANGIMHPAMRICELRKRGYNIVTNWVTQTDDAGVTHRVGIYTMDGPEK